MIEEFITAKSEDIFAVMKMLARKSRGSQSGPGRE